MFRKLCCLPSLIGNVLRKSVFPAKYVCCTYGDCQRRIHEEKILLKDWLRFSTRVGCLIHRAQFQSQPERHLLPILGLHCKPMRRLSHSPKRRPRISLRVLVCVPDPPHSIRALSHPPRSCFPQGIAKSRSCRKGLLPSHGHSCLSLAHCRKWLLSSSPDLTLRSCMPIPDRPSDAEKCATISRENLPDA